MEQKQYYRLLEPDEKTVPGDEWFNSGIGIYQWQPVSGAIVGAYATVPVRRLITKPAWPEPKRTTEPLPKADYFLCWDGSTWLRQPRESVSSFDWWLPMPPAPPDWELAWEKEYGGIVFESAAAKNQNMECFQAGFELAQSAAQQGRREKARP